MYLSVKERGDYVATFRWIEVRLMETLAAWVPTTPEMEAKLVFGTHIWDTAQHADALGKRTHELRLPLHDSLRPSDAYVAFLDDVRSIDDTAQRVAAFYDVVLPALERRMRDYLTQVDMLLDGPTVRILERIFFDMTRMTGERDALYEEAPALRLDDDAWLAAQREQESSVAAIVGERAPVAVSGG